MYIVSKMLTFERERELIYLPQMDAVPNMTKLIKNPTIATTLDQEKYI